MWIPQSWEGASQEYTSTPLDVGDGDLIRFYTRIEINDDYGMLYRVYTYDTYGWYYDDPTTYDWSHATDESSLRVGYEYNNGIKHKFFQFGVESNTAITNTDWQVVNDNPCYHYSGTTWQYKAGKVCQGIAPITWIGNNSYGVGGENYTGVNIDHSQPYEVIWEYAGTTAADEASLWTETGTISDSHTTPYEIID